jgi:hypothetical protein
VANEIASGARKGEREKRKEGSRPGRKKKGFSEQEAGASVRLKIGILCAPLLQQPEC